MTSGKGVPLVRITGLPPRPDFTRGLCTRPANSHWWTSEDASEREGARRSCMCCPLLTQCRAWSLSLPTYNDKVIYGGWTGAERARRKRAAKARAERRREAQRRYNRQSEKRRRLLGLAPSSRERYAGDPEPFKASAKSYYERNREQVKEKRRARHAANREAVNAARRAAYAAAQAANLSAVKSGSAAGR